MVRILFILANLAVALNCYSQSHIWSKKFNSTLSNAALKMDVDTAGYSYTVGGFYGTADFDPGSGVYNLSSVGNYVNPYICKLDPAGNFVWAFKIGDSALAYFNSVAVEPDGDYFYISGGVMMGSIDLDPGSGVTRINSSAGFLAKYNSNGNLVWGHQIGSRTIELDLDDSNHVLVLGSFKDTCDFDFGSGVAKISGRDNEFLAKYTDAGVYRWVKNISGSNTATGSVLAQEMVTDSKGNIYIAGSFAFWPDVDPDTSAVYLQYSGTMFYGIDDIFIVSYTPGGIYRWNVVAGNATQAQNAVGLDVDGMGNTYIGGPFVGTADFDPGPGTANLTATYTNAEDAYLASYDSMGRYRWAYSMKTLGALWSIDVNYFGDIFCTGWFRSTADFDFGTGTQILTASGPGDIFFNRYDKNANLIWARQISGADIEDASTIKKISNGSIYLCGNFFKTTDFDPDPGVANLTAGGNYQNSFVAKYRCPGPAAPASISGPKRVCRGQNKVRFTVSTVPGSSRYHWTVPAGVTIDSAVTNAVWLSFGNQTSNVSLQARAENGCAIGPLSPAFSVLIDSFTYAKAFSFQGDTLCGNDTLLLTSDTTHALSYRWEMGSSLMGTASTLKVTKPGLYKLKIQTSCGERTDSINIYTPFPAKVLAPFGDSLCPGDTLILSADTGQGQSYRWDWGSNSDSTYSIKVTESGVYKLTVKNVCGTTQDSIVIRSLAPLAPIQSTGSHICPGGNITLNHKQPIPGYRYQWQLNGNDLSSDTSAHLQTATAGIYSLVVTRNSCSSLSENIQIFKDSLEAQILADTMLCPGDTTLLQAISINSQALRYAWKHNGLLMPDDTLDVLYAISPGNYQVTVKDSFCQASSYVQIKSDTLDLIKIEPPLDSILCPGDSLVLKIKSPAAGLQWFHNSTTLVGDSLGVLIIHQPGRYILAAKSKCGVAKDSVDIVSAIVPKPELQDTLKTCILPVKLNAGTNAQRYSWSTGDSTRIIEVNSQGLYTLKAWNHASCPATDSILLVHDPDAGELLLPNVFTPDNNGLNDEFSIGTPPVTSFELVILNRWGQEVFRSTQATQGWNGETPEGKAPAGTYYFKLKFTGLCDGKQVSKWGTVMLIRE